MSSFPNLLIIVLRRPSCAVQMSVHAEYKSVSRIDRFMQGGFVRQSIHTLSGQMFKKKKNHLHVRHAHQTNSALQKYKLLNRFPRTLQL